MIADATLKGLVVAAKSVQADKSMALFAKTLDDALPDVLRARDEWQMVQGARYAIEYLLAISQSDAKASVIKEVPMPIIQIFAEYLNDLRG